MVSELMFPKKKEVLSITKALILLYFSTNIDELINKKIATEPQFRQSEIYPSIKSAIAKLQSKLKEPIKKKYYLHRTIDSHILPLTNVCFDRTGKYCLTGSYDRTCRIIDTLTGAGIEILKGHDNVVFSVGFNFPNW